MQNFMGMDGFIWFTGVVEDRNDPSKLGRVRVRCVGHSWTHMVSKQTEHKVCTKKLQCNLYSRRLV